jgi:cellulose biosynthesis protein BcsQ
MNVITLASRKGGVGKSTLTAHLAAFAHLMGHRCMVVDADPQGSLTLWHSMRADGNGDSACKLEIARLWSAIERSVDAINRAQAGTGNTRGRAA